MGNGLVLKRWQAVTSVSILRPRQNGRHFAATFSNAFSSMKIYEFWLTIHWSLFLRVQLTMFQHWFRQWLGVDQATSHYLNPWWSSLHASLGLNELMVIILYFMPKTAGDTTERETIQLQFFSDINIASDVFWNSKAINSIPQETIIIIICPRLNLS